MRCVFLASVCFVLLTQILTLFKRQVSGAAMSLTAAASRFIVVLLSVSGTVLLPLHFKVSNQLFYNYLFLCLAEYDKTNKLEVTPDGNLNQKPFPVIRLQKLGLK